MASAHQIVGRGFLPRELPPPFYSETFGSFVRSGWRPRVPNSTASGVHNLFRWGGLRRQLSIPNPLAYLALALEIEANWSHLRSLLRLSPWTISRPVRSRNRAVGPYRSQRVFTLARADVRAGARYVVRADLARFYHSVYTHTLEWAVHTKAVAKANYALPRARQQFLWGSKLDSRHRALQGRQSIGIPVGPDTSLIAAELLLGRVDQVLSQRLRCRGVRYVDDYELGFASLAEAEYGLAALQEVLAEYELALNPVKTKIVELPAALEASWTHVLRRIRVRPATGGQRYDFVDLFDAAFDLRNVNPDAHVLRFAMGIVRHATILPQNWRLLQALLLQAVAVEPGIVREVLVILEQNRLAGRNLDLSRVQETLSDIIVRHAPLGHGSEVAWAIWAHIHFSIPVDDRCLVAVEGMDDPIPILVILDASARGLTNRTPGSTSWAALMTSGGLLESSWLLTYEAAVKGWLPGGHIRRDADFAAMRNAGVEFYRVLPTPSAALTSLRTAGGDMEGYVG
jgi:hypothetical protein